MLTRLITDRRAWTRATLDVPGNWYFTLPGAVLDMLDREIAVRRRRPVPTTELRAGGDLLRAGTVVLKPVRDELEAGRGFVIIDGVQTGRYSPEELQAIYWLVGQLLGRPVVQNVQGTLLYDVRDTGQDVRYGARFSVTNAESTFHTDNSFGEELVDYVGLLCLSTAKSGGLSQVVSIFAVHNRLVEKHRDVLELLYQPYHIDRRAGVRAGEAPTVQQPVLAWDGRELLCRYLRYWVEVGQDKAGAPLTPEQTKALDALDRVAAEPDLRAEFALKPGDMYFINNRWIMHNRTAFEDHTEPERKRHLVRLWLSAQN